MLKQRLYFFTKILNKDCICYFIFIFFLILSIWHSFYCLEITDEPYFIALADAMWKGSKPFVDIWAMHQTSAILLLPFVGIWHIITGGTDGIIVYIRILYACIQCLLAFYTYYQLRKYLQCNVFFACLISLFCQLTSVLGIQTLNYNAFVLLFGQLCFIELLMLMHKVSKIRLFWLGFFNALLVQSYPSMVIVYIIIIFSVFFIIYKWHKRYADCRLILYLVAGSLLALILFLGILWLLNVTPIDMLKNIHYVLTPDRSIETLKANKVKELIDEFFDYTGLFGKIILIINILVIIVYKVLTHKNRKTTFKTSFLLIAFIVGGVFFCTIWNSNVLINLPSHPLINYAPSFIVLGSTIITVLCLLMDNEKSILSFEKSVLLVFFSFAFWSVMHFTTDGGIRMSAAGFIFFLEYYMIRIGIHFKFDCSHNNMNISDQHILLFIFDNEHVKTCLVRALGIFVIIIALGALGGSRILGHYRENDLRDLNTRINVGPAKGIITTQINAHNYSEMLAVANRACENSYSLAVEIYYPLAYLSQKCRMHAYTTGRIAISSNRLDLWYEVHHYALPDTVIVYKNKYNQWQWNDDTDTDGFLGNSISSIDLFEKKETPYADIYIKKQ